MKLLKQLNEIERARSWAKMDYPEAIKLSLEDFLAQFFHSNRNDRNDYLPNKNLLVYLNDSSYSRVGRINDGRIKTIHHWEGGRAKGKVIDVFDRTETSRKGLRHAEAPGKKLGSFRIV